jgi:DNA replication and repair protein RecF
MYLKKLQLTNFKNYTFTELEFSEKMNCFSGDNGSGKTNLLDAIYYLSFTKSFFNQMDQQNIRNGEDFFRIEGSFSLDGERSDSLECVQEKNHRKILRLNKKEYERLADHIGLIPLVMISPADSNLIYSGSEERRKYFDSVISQFDKVYLEDLISYQKILFQRNKLLKQFAETRSFDTDALDLWDRQMIPLGKRIFEKRSEFIKLFKPVFSRHFEGISGGREEVELIYESALAGADFNDLIIRSREQDRFASYTTQGIHKDDFPFLMNGMPLKKFGSQGQQKSFMIAVKLAQFDYTRDIKGYKPLLLLDDVFDKLDDTRVENLLKLVSEDHFGQIFITDTSAARLQHAIEKTNSAFAIFSIKAGEAEAYLLS